MQKFYITAAIPYVNAEPHIGHALEFVQGDVLARYHHSIGDQTYYVTGADENSLKNVAAAEKLGIEVIEENSKIVKDCRVNPKAIEALIGRVMQKTKGQADPHITRTIILELLKKKGITE